jgi:hypothetical protein
MPVQVKRLLLAFAIFIVMMLVLKYYLTPESWREYGPYRGKALTEISDRTVTYVQMETCAMCHDSIAEIKTQSMHKSIQCEVCHGPGNMHADDPDNNKMELLSGPFCLRCHTKNAARPENIIKQIDAAEHNVGEECLTCHNPHQP